MLVVYLVGEVFGLEDVSNSKLVCRLYLLYKHFLLI